MKKANYLLPILIVVALAAGCGGGGSSASLEKDDVAVVGSQHIPATMFDALMNQAKRSFKSQNKKFPVKFYVVAMLSSRPSARRRPPTWA